MNLPEFEKKIKEIIPNAIVETGERGELIIYTGFKMAEEKNYLSDIIPMNEEENKEGLIK